MVLATQTGKVGRRSFLGYVIAAVGAFITTVLGASAAVFAASPVLTTRRSVEVSLGAVNSFPLGIPKLVEFPISVKDGWIVENVTKSVWVVRTGENDLIALSPRCTHLGCAVSWLPEQQRFRSPCHGGFFSLNGSVVAGPPPRPLDRLESRIEGGKLVVDYKEFRLGIPEKVEV